MNVYGCALFLLPVLRIVSMTQKLMTGKQGVSSPAQKTHTFLYECMHCFSLAILDNHWVHTGKRNSAHLPIHISLFFVPNMMPCFCLVLLCLCHGANFRQSLGAHRQEKQHASIFVSFCVFCCVLPSCSPARQLFALIPME